MSKLSKVEQTKKAKDEYNHPIKDLLLERTTKAKVCEVLHCSEREAREFISECAMHFPVISLSKKDSGYRRAKAINSLDDTQLEFEIGEVKEMIAELNSRVKCLKKRMKPLIAWLKMAEKEVTKRGNGER